MVNHYSSTFWKKAFKISHIVLSEKLQGHTVSILSDLRGKMGEKISFFKTLEYQITQPIPQKEDYITCATPQGKILGTSWSIRSKPVHAFLQSFESISLRTKDSPRSGGWLSWGLTRSGPASFCIRSSFDNRCRHPCLIVAKLSLRVSLTDVRGEETNCIGNRREELLFVCTLQDMVHQTDIWKRSCRISFP